MRLISIIICDYANITQDGRFNLLGGGIDQIIAHRAPTPETPARGAFHIALRIETEPGEEGQHNATIFIMRPDGSRIEPSFNLQFNIQRGKRFHNFILGLQGFPIVETGPHSVEVLVDGHNLGHAPFEIVTPARAA